MMSMCGGSSSSCSTELDEDLLIKVFFHLSPEDLACCSLTCKLWHRAASDGALWRHLCVERWPSLRDPASDRIRSFWIFFSQRASPALHMNGRPWCSSFSKELNVFLADEAGVTFFVDVSLHERPFFCRAVAGSSALKERLRLKLPQLPPRAGASTAVHSDVTEPFTHLHVQLSVVRHSDGRSLCLVNGFPARKKKKEEAVNIIQSFCRTAFNCVLMLIDNHAFLNFFW